MPKPVAVGTLPNGSRFQTIPLRMRGWILGRRKGAVRVHFAPKKVKVRGEVWFYPAHDMNLHPEYLVEEVRTNGDAE